MYGMYSSCQCYYLIDFKGLRLQECWNVGMKGELGNTHRFKGQCIWQLILPALHTKSSLWVKSEYTICTPIDRPRWTWETLGLINNDSSFISPSIIAIYIHFMSWFIYFPCFRSVNYGSTYTKMNDKIRSRTVLSYLYVCPTNKRKVNIKVYLIFFLFLCTIGLDILFTSYIPNVKT